MNFNAFQNHTQGTLSSIQQPINLYNGMYYPETSALGINTYYQTTDPDCFQFTGATVPPGTTSPHLIQSSSPDAFQGQSNMLNGMSSSAWYSRLSPSPTANLMANSAEHPSYSSLVSPVSFHPSMDIGSIINPYEEIQPPPYNPQLTATHQNQAPIACSFPDFGTATHQTMQSPWPARGPTNQAPIACSFPDLAQIIPGMPAPMFRNMRFQRIRHNFGTQSCFIPPIDQATPVSKWANSRQEYCGSMAAMDGFCKTLAGFLLTATRSLISMFQDLILLENDCTQTPERPIQLSTPVGDGEFIPSHSYRSTGLSEIDNSQQNREVLLTDQQDKTISDEVFRAIRLWH